ncbi:MAG: hypothetical protein ACYTFV_08740, partial [Planctomycetota bacterium]
MLIATQTPDYNDPLNLHEETLCLAGPVGGTLFDLFGNPVLLKELWPEVRKRFALQIAEEPRCAARSRRSRKGKLTRLAVDLVLDRLADEGRKTSIRRRIDTHRPLLRSRIIERCRATGQDQAKRLLLYCGRPELTPEQRVQALLELFL